MQRWGASGSRSASRGHTGVRLTVKLSCSVFVRVESSHRVEKDYCKGLSKMAAAESPLPTLTLKDFLSLKPPDFVFQVQIQHACSKIIRLILVF